MRIKEKSIGWIFFAVIILFVLVISSTILSVFVSHYPMYREKPLVSAAKSVANFFVIKLDLSGIPSKESLKPARFVGNVSKNLVTKTLLGEYPAKIERIEIDLKFKYLIDLEKERNRALATGILWQPKTYPAKIRYRGKSFKADIRLKGDLSNHWTGPNRWSFRVKLKGGKSILGMNRFSLQKPKSRSIPSDAMFQSWIRAMGNLAPRHEYVRVSFNGDYWGIMDVEEHISKQFLEVARRKEAPVIKLSSEEDWVFEKINKGKRIPHTFFGRMDTSLFGDGKYANNKHILGLYSYAVESYRKVINGEMPVEDFVDINSFSKAIIAVVAWQNKHTMSLSNSRFYLNPYTLKLEIVTGDQGDPFSIDRPSRATDTRIRLTSRWDYQLYSEIMSSPEFARRFGRNFEQAKAAMSALKVERRKICSTFPIDCPESKIRVVESNMRRLEDLGPAYFVELAKSVPKSYAEEASHDGTRGIQNADENLDYPRHIVAEYYSSGRLVIWNVVNRNAVLERVRLNCSNRVDCGKNEFLNGPVSLPADTDKFSPSPVVLSISPGLQLNKDRALSLATRVSGEIKYEEIALTRDDGFRNPLYDWKSLDIGDAMREHRYLTVRDRDLEIRPGTWNVSKPIIVPPGYRLVISPGTTLYFDEDAYVISHGPVYARGTAAKPIDFRPKQSGRWLGMYVVDAGAQSQLSYTTVSGTKGVSVGLLKLTGGVTFYGSPVRMNHVGFVDTVAEDALNLVRSPFEIDEVRFSKTVSDAIDLDFSDGRLSRANFTGIGGDGLDTSGSKVRAENLVFDGVVDKAVSAGEASTLDVSDVQATRVGSGVVSKDGSRVIVRRLKVDNAVLYSGMAYTKKSFYGPSRLDVYQTQSRSSEFFSQRSNVISVDGVKIAERDLDVQSLYASGPMKKNKAAR